MNDKENLFVYGTLKDANTQQKIFGRSVSGVSDMLLDYKKSEVMIDNEIYPTIVTSYGDFVKGLLILVTDKELKIIDDYETSAYKRIKVILKSGIAAWVYAKDKNHLK